MNIVSSWRLLLGARSRSREKLSPRLRAAQELKELIASGALKQGARFPPEETLAKKLGVSRPTLRRALELLENEGLLRGRKGREVMPAEGEGGESISSVIADTIVVLANRQPDLKASPRRIGGLEVMIQNGVMQAIGELSLHALTLHPQRLNENVSKNLVEGRPHGVVGLQWVMYWDQGRQFMEGMKTAGIPVVLYGFEPDWAEFDTLVSDHDAGCYELTRYLLGRGCKRILRFWYGTNRHPIRRPHWITSRDAGYERAMREAGLQALPIVEPQGFVSNIEKFTRAGFDAEVRIIAGFLLEHLLGKDPVDAILAGSDGEVPQIAAACRLLGKTPNVDVLIAGYDNSFRTSTWEQEWEATRPVATMDKQNALLGQKLIELVEQRGAGTLGKEPAHWKIPPKFLLVAQ